MEERFQIHLQPLVHVEHLVVSSDVAGVRLNLLCLRVLDLRDGLIEILVYAYAHRGESGKAECTRLQLTEAAHR